MVILRFLEYEAWRMIGICPMNLQQANGKEILAWIPLELGFQFFFFKQKFQVLLMPFCAALWLAWLGLCLCLCNGSIRLTNLIRISCIHDFEIWFPSFIFSNIFHAILYQLRSIQSKSFYIESCTKSWGQNMHKKIC